jgi:hypothetical protein
VSSPEIDYIARVYNYLLEIRHTSCIHNISRGFNRDRLEFATWSAQNISFESRATREERNKIVGAMTYELCLASEI